MKHMNKKVVKRIFIGVGLYAVFVMAVIMLYPDTPHNMDWEDRQEFSKVQISKLDECTALLFENDELIAWGDSAYQSFVDG